MAHQIDQSGWLCRSCRRAFKQLLDDADYESVPIEKLRNDWQDKQAKLHENLSILEQSALDKCPTCRLLRQKIAIYLDPMTYEKLVSSSTKIILSRRREPTAPGSKTAWSVVCFKFQGDVGAILPGSIALTNFAESCYNYGSSSSCPQVCGLYEETGRLGQYVLQDLKSREETTAHAARAEAAFGSSSQQSLLQVREWLIRCKTQHSACDAAQEGLSYVPKRLILIEAVGLDQLRTRLVVSSALAPKTPYTALSYSWGKGVEYFMTTRANYENHLNGIEFEKLPKTFADACKVTHSLGIDYIWIDALCIIQPDQDDSEDWGTESLKMRDVYRNAELTISAASASNVHQGLFQPRPAAIYQTLPCKIEDLCSKHFTCSHHSSDVFSIVPSAPDWNRHVDRSPISSRAWVFQERFLSSRTIHFAQHSIFWECADLSASEYEPSGCTSIHKTYRFRRLVDLDGLTDFDPLWTKTIQDFSNRKITFPSDNLPAISGVAKSFAHYNPDDTYLAGLWRNSIPRSLAWNTRIYPHAWQDQPIPRTREITCPTWSWASIRTPIIYSVLNSVLTTTTTWLVDVLDVGTTPTGPDPFGKITSGYLSLRGKLKRFTVNDTDALARSRIGQFDLNSATISGGVSLCVDELVVFESVMAGEYKDRGVLGLRLCRTTWDNGVDIDATLLYLVIEPCEGEEGRYRRVGILSESRSVREVEECDDGVVTDVVVV